MHRISGLSREQESLYRHLLATGPTSVEALVEKFGSHIHDDLYELTVRGLAHGSPLMARRPSVALQGVLTQQEANFRQAQVYVEQLDRLYESANESIGEDAVTVLTQRSMVQHWYETLHATAHNEVMQLITHPFLPLSNPGKLGVKNEPDDDNHPVKCRVICEWQVFQNQKAIRGMQHSIERGCEIRLADRLPNKLLIGDRQLAMTPRFPRDHEVKHMLVVHPGSLLDFLVQVFEAEWERALPIQPDPGRFAGPGDDLDKDEMVIVEMLVGGAPVERIAGALGVHVRTMNRRLDELKRKANVTTLFQLGAYASRHWLT